MRRADALLMLVVVAFAVFVGIQVLNRPMNVRRPEVAAAYARLEQIAPTVTADERTVVVSNSHNPAPPAPAAGGTTVAERITGTPGTYMPDMLRDLKGALVRWPDRRESGLRVWVQSITPVHDWDLRYAQMARDAFADWGQDLPVRFDFVLDSATADVQIVWIERFPAELGQRVGTTNRTNDQNGWIVAARIIVAVHDSGGRTIPPEGLAGIVRHEAGHALGLGHSNDPKTKMYPIEMQSQISAADRATLKLLYELPPGVVR